MIYMGLINNVDMVCLSPVGYVCSDEGLTLETSAKHHIISPYHITISYHHIWCLADVSSVSPSSEQSAPTKG